MLNKRGDVGFGTLATIVLIGLAIVLIALGLYNWFTPVLDFPGKADVNQEFLSQKCSQTFSFDASGSGFCNGLIEVANRMYINCPYAIDFYGVILQENSVPNDIVPLCTGAEIKMCNRLSLEKDNFDSEKYGVNGKLCKDWYDTRKTCEDQIVAAGFDLAAWMDADECVISPINEQVTIIPESSIKDTDVTEHKDQVCCSVKKKA